MAKLWKYIIFQYGFPWSCFRIAATGSHVGREEGKLPTAETDWWILFLSGIAYGQSPLVSLQTEIAEPKIIMCSVTHLLRGLHIDSKVLLLSKVIFREVWRFESSIKKGLANVYRFHCLCFDNTTIMKYNKEQRFPARFETIFGQNIDISYSKPSWSKIVSKIFVNVTFTEDCTPATWPWRQQ